MATAGARLFVEVTKGNVPTPLKPVPLPKLWNELLYGADSLIKPGVPSAFVSCQDKHDVAQVVRQAVASRQPLAAKSSGHQFGGTCLVDGGLVADVSRLKAISVDAEARMAVIGAGVTCGDLYAALAPYQLHFPAGHSLGLSVSGVVLGGGFGWGSAKWGAACDSVLGAEVVLPVDTPTTDTSSPADQVASVADGHKVYTCDPTYVSAQSDPDLFAAFMGAGTVLGIATEYKLQLYPVPANLPCMMVSYPLDCLHEVAALHAELTAPSPTTVEVSCVLARARAPPHDPCVILVLTGFADDDEVQQAREKVRNLLPNQRQILQDDAVPYLKALSRVDLIAPGSAVYGHGCFVAPTKMTPAFLDVLKEGLLATTWTRTNIAIHSPFARTTQQTAACFRGDVLVSMLAAWPRTEAGAAADGDEQHVAWVKKLAAKVEPSVSGLFVNQAMLTEPGQRAKCYTPEVLDLVARVKSVTDPYGLLHPLTI